MQWTLSRNVSSLTFVFENKDSDCDRVLKGRVKSSKKNLFAEQIQRCHIVLLILTKYKKCTSEPKFKFKFSNSDTITYINVKIR